MVRECIDHFEDSIRGRAISRGCQHVRSGPTDEGNVDDVAVFLRGRNPPEEKIRWEFLREFRKLLRRHLKIMGGSCEKISGLSMIDANY